jgi:hypothetical protein
VLLGSPEAMSIRAAAREDLRQGRKAAARGRQGPFKTVMNEIGYCAEKRKDLHSGIRREELGNGRRNAELKLIIKTCPSATTATVE